VTVSAPAPEELRARSDIEESIKGEVFGLCDRLQMGRVAAALIAALVMEDAALRNRADEELVDDPVHLPHGVPQEDAAVIAGADGAYPEPAAVRRLLYLERKATKLGRGKGKDAAVVARIDHEKAPE
jgi:hypothetical protein